MVCLLGLTAKDIKRNTHRYAGLNKTKYKKAGYTSFKVNARKIIQSWRKVERRAR